MEDLKGKTLAGLRWNLSERAGVQVVQFLPTVVLARLVAPEEFGLIGMLSLFIALANAFTDSGFGAALIRKKDASYVDECSIFYFNILVGSVVVLILCFAAPLIAGFYDQPMLTALTRLLSLEILIRSFGLIQTTRLTRQLDFKTQFQANLFATCAAGALAIAAAYRGWGVWSLALQTLSKVLFGVGALWLICDWRPALIFRLASLQEMFGFGSRMLSSGLVSVFFDNLYQVFIGKVFSASALGYFTRAAALRSVVLDSSSHALDRVLYPALASIQDDRARLKRACRRSLRLATFIHFPMIMVLIVAADPLINLLFSARWKESVVFFQLMCASMLLYPLHVINLDILQVKGRSDLFLRLEIIKRSMIILNILITYRWGINAMLLGQCVATLIAYFLNSYYSERLIAYALKAQILDVLPAFVFSLVMAGGMMIAGAAMPATNRFMVLTAQTGLGAGVYLLLHWVKRSEAWKELVELARQER
jgi:O-antigen/teichoic acid export membrane protein